MAHILITSGPTRQYLDPVRYLSNASSGKMGSCLAQAALELGYEVTIISGPVSIKYPDAANVIEVVSTQQMLSAAVKAFAQCDGVIAAAAPCDFKHKDYSEQKIKRTPQAMELQLVPTQDILVELGSKKQANQWSVGFALETEDGKSRALKKLEVKNCDLIVLNGPTAIESPENQVDIINPEGEVVCSVAGPKETVAKKILEVIQNQLMSD